LSKFEQAGIVSSPETPFAEAQFTTLSHQKKKHSRKAKKGKKQKQNKTKNAAQQWWVLSAKRQWVYIARDID
jgi:hypothetical protein